MLPTRVVTIVASLSLMPTRKKGKYKVSLALFYQRRSKFYFYN